MPPKRNLKQPVLVVSDSESDRVSLRRPKETNFLSTILYNVEKLKHKRQDHRNNIVAKFNACTSKKKKEIEGHYASEARRRSAELKDLLTRYAQALEQQIQIENSIENEVGKLRKASMELTEMLKATYSGCWERTHAAAGAFGSVRPVPANNKASANPKNTAGTANTVHQAQADRREEGRSRNGGHCFAGKPNVFDQITW